MKRVPVSLPFFLVSIWVIFACSLGFQAQTATPTLVASSAGTSSPADDLYQSPAATQPGAGAPGAETATQPADPLPAASQPALATLATATLATATQATASTATSAPATTGAAATGAAAAAPGQNLANTSDPTLVSNLIDGEIAGPDGTELAEIDSLVLDRAAGQIAYVFLKTDVDLEDADQVVAVPWAAFQVTEDANDTLDRITFTLDPALLAAAPALVVTDLYNYNDPAWDDQTAAYWSSQAASLLPDTGAGSTAAGMARLKDEDDLNLLDAQGGLVAEVKEVVIDPASGGFRYVLVEPAGGTGVIEEQVPIPFEKLSWNSPAPDALLLNVDRAVLAAAPRYQGDNALPDTAVPGWDDAVKQYWAGQ